MKYKCKYLYIILAFLVLFPMLSACSKGVSPAVLNVYIGSEIGSYDPQFCVTPEGGTIALHLFEGLTKINSKGKAELAAANSYELSEDELVYTFSLRDGIRWSDGKTVKSTDFVYAWQRLVTPENNAESRCLVDMVEGVTKIIYPNTGYSPTQKDIEAIGVRAIDSRTIEFKLKRKCPYFLEVLAMPAALPVKRDVVALGSEQWTINPETCVGNGMYSLSEYREDAIVLKRNTNHYAYKTAGPKEIVFHLYDENTARTAYENGELSFSEAIPASDSEKSDVIKNDSNGTFYLLFNTGNEPFNNPNVRTAFSLVMPRQSSYGEQTNYTAAFSFVPPTVAGYKSSSRFSKEYYSTDPNELLKNAETAKEILAQNGYPDGVGLPVIKYVFPNSPQQLAIAERVKENLQEFLGVSVSLLGFEWQEFINLRIEGDFHITSASWISDFSDPMPFLELFTSTNVLNDARFVNEEYDSLLKKAANSNNVEFRFNFAEQAQDLLIREAPIAPLFFYAENYQVKSNLKGFYATRNGYKCFMNVTF